MITLEANYSKKIGLPGYSSHQFSVTLRTEIADLSKVQEESARLYRELQNAVDTSIQQVGFLPETVGSMITNGNGSKANGQEVWKCSDKQKALILKIVDENELDKNQVEALARQRAVAEASQKIRSDVETFVADCVASLREQTAQLCQEMLNSINNCETGVHQKTLNRLVRFIDQFKQMNFVNDTVMTEQLENVRKELLTKTAEEYRDNRTARSRLVQGLSQLRDQANQLAKQDATELVQRFGGIGRRKFNLAA